MSKYKAGDKVVIRKDLEVDEFYGDYHWRKEKRYLQEKNYVTIEKVTGSGFYQVHMWIITDEMIEGLYEEPKKYVWYLEHKGKVYFLYHEGKCVTSSDEGSDYTKRVKEGMHDSFLITEEQAKQSPFFDKFKKHDPLEEKLYYILVKGQDWQDREYLNLDVESSKYFFSDGVELADFKTKFTEKEADELIGASPILYKELVNEK